MLRLSARTVVKSLRAAQLLETPLMMMAQQKTPAPHRAAQKADITSKLATQLEEEIKYEKENPPNADSALQAIKDKGWTLSNEGLLYELKKQVGDKTIVVSFAARSPPAEPEEPKEQADAKKGEEEESAPEDLVEFSVYVTKPGSETLVAEYLINGLEVRCGPLR